jgi:hypothetical protein
VRRLFALGLLVATLAMAPATAFAAAPVATGDMDVQLWAAAQPGQAVVIVGVSLPEQVQLPATVRIPVVAGMQVDWAGEILDSAASQDPQRAFTLKDGAGGQYAEFEISQSRKAQVELSGLPLSATGGGFSAAVDYVQTAPAPVTGFSVRLPAGAREASITPPPAGSPDQNEAGETLYTLPSAELGEGETVRVAVSYSTGTPTPVAAQSTDSSAIIVLLLVALVLAVGVLLVVVRRQRAAGSPE